MSDSFSFASSERVIESRCVFFHIIKKIAGTLG